MMRVQVGLAFLLFLCSSVPVSAQYCRVQLSMQNSNRWVTSDSIHAECTPGWHTVPFGNWGVDSIWGSRVDGNQFAGWDGMFQSSEWNSCTDTYPWDPDRFGVGVFYNEDLNYNNLGDAQSSSTAYFYAGAYLDYWDDCPKDTNWDGLCDAGGCSGQQAFTFSFPYEYLNLYELDWPDSDDWVGTLYVNGGGCQVQFQYCDLWGCGGPEYSGWCPTYASDLGSAQVRMILGGAMFIDEWDYMANMTYCEALAQSYPEYACQ
jgi:hypothetical protein